MAQGFQLDGRIHLINEIQTFDSGFSKREFVIETVDQYPQMVKFDLVKERTALTDNLSQGDQVVVHFDIRGNEYQGKYYVNLNCWRLDSGSQAQQPTQGQPMQQQQQPMQQQPMQQQQQPAVQQPAPQQPNQTPGGFDDTDEDIPF